MLAHLRTEAYDVYRSAGYPPRAQPDATLTYEENVHRIAVAKEAREPLPGPVRTPVEQVRAVHAASATAQTTSGEPPGPDAPLKRTRPAT